MPRMLWLLALRACVDGRVVCDYGRPEATELQHLPQNLQCSLWLLALLARADVHVVGDHGAREASKLQLWNIHGTVLACVPSAHALNGRIAGDHGSLTSLLI